MTIPTKNPGMIRFKGVITQSDKSSNSWAWVEFPYELKELYGIGNLVPVIITFDDIEYKGSITKMGGTYPKLLIKRDILSRLNKKRGDSVDVSVILDDKPRQVIIPTELEKAFIDKPEARSIYNKLAYSHRREYSQWISSAKQIETRQRRAKKAIDTIMANKK